MVFQCFCVKLSIFVQWKFWYAKDLCTRVDVSEFYIFVRGCNVEVYYHDMGLFYFECSVTSLNSKSIYF